MHSESKGTTMPRYFFHVRSLGGGVAEDTEGIELPDLETARAKAEQSAADLSFEARESDELIEVEAVEIADMTGDILAVIPFKLHVAEPLSAFLGYQRRLGSGASSLKPAFAGRRGNLPHPVAIQINPSQPGSHEVTLGNPAGESAW